MATTAPYHLPPHMLTGDSTFVASEMVKVTLEPNKLSCKPIYEDVGFSLYFDVGCPACTSQKCCPLGDC